MNERPTRKSPAREALAERGATGELRSRRFHAFLANWAKRHMPERVKRFSVRA